MHQIGVVGLSYRHVGVDEVARFSVPKAEVAARLPALRDALGVSEIFYVATCNRVEVLFAMPDGAPAGDARHEVFRALIGRDPIAGEATRILRAWTGEAAVEHLFLVTCGLDSAQAGEQEIAAQIRLAWETARGVQVCGPTLDKLLSESLSMAHRVHKLEANVRSPSLADLAADRIVRQFNGNLATVALVGVSPMTRRCGMILHRAGIPLLVVNRTVQAAEEFAATVGGRAMQLDQFRESPTELGALVLAAGGGEPVLDAKALTRIAAAAGARTPLLLDFGVPPNADPEATGLAGIARVGMDDLIQAAQERRLSQLMRLAPVRAAIDERLNRLRGELATRAIGRRLADLRGTFEQIAAEEVDRALADELSDLDAGQRELLQRFASTVARRLAHLPLAGLRAAAAHASTDAVDAFFREARLRRPANGEAIAADALASDSQHNGLGAGVLADSGRHRKLTGDVLDAAARDNGHGVDVLNAAALRNGVGTHTDGLHNGLGNAAADAGARDAGGRQGSGFTDVPDTAGPQNGLGADAGNVAAGRQRTLAAAGRQSPAAPIRSAWSKD